MADLELPVRPAAGRGPRELVDRARRDARRPGAPPGDLAELPGSAEFPAKRAGRNSAPHRFLMLKGMAAPQIPAAAGIPCRGHSRGLSEGANSTFA